MRLGSFAGFALAAAVFSGGCASILGLDSYESSNGGQSATGSTSTSPTTGPGGPNGSNSASTMSNTASSGDTTVTASTGNAPPGDVVWVSSFGSPDDDEAWGIAVTDAGDLYLSGMTLTATTTAISIGKLDANGGSEWVKDFVIGDADAFYARNFGVVADETGVIFAGNITGAGVTIEGEPAEGAFVAKLDPDGGLLWVRSCAGTLSFESRYSSGGLSFTPFAGNPRGAVVMSVPSNSGMGCGTAGSGVVGARINADTGVVLAGLAFDADGYERNTHVASGADGNLFVSAWGFVRAFNAGGTQLWSHDFYTPSYDVAFDPQSGGAVLVGETNTQTMLDLGGGPANVDGEGFIARYDGSGTFIRQTFFGPPGQGRAVRVDGDGALYLAAGFGAAAHFGDNVPFVPVSTNDGAVVKIDKDNNLIWKHHVEGVAGGNVEINAIALGTDRVIAFGHYDGGALNVEGEMLTSAGGRDVFVMSMLH